MLRQKFSNVFQPFIALRVEFKSLANHWGLLFVYYNSFVARIVYVAHWRKAWIFTSFHFLAQTSFSIFGKRIHIVFALPKGDVEHKFSLRGIFRPESWKFQYRQMPAIQKINYFSTINRIARQSIRMPSQNSVCFAALYAIEHIVKYRTARNFGRLFFHKLLSYVEIFLFRKSAQFCNLIFNRTHLLIFHIGGLAGIQKEFLR